MNNKVLGGAVLAVLLAVAAPVFAETATTTSVKPTTNIACVQAAVDVREQGIIDAWTTFNSSMISTLTTRKSALHDAWGMTDGTARRAARSAAWTTFQTSSRAAHTTLRTTREAIWNTFRTASKACGVVVVEARGLDTAGTIGL